MQRPGVFILSTGTELSSGRSTDTNGPYLARAMAEEGFQVFGMIILPDDPKALVAELKRVRNLDGLNGVIMTGGLGPTEDDHTVDVLAELTGDEIVEEPEALRKLELLGRRWKRRFNAEAARRQVRVLRNAVVLKNEAGLAPGLFTRITDTAASANAGDFFVAAMPGVPQEMLAMFNDQLLPTLREAYPTRTKHRRVFHLYGVGESTFQSQFFGMEKKSRDIEPPPEGLPIERESLTPDFNWGITSARGLIKIFFESFEEDEVAQLDALAAQAYASTYLRDTVQRELQDFCLREGLTVALAESCTGGWTAKTLTDLPGGSAYFKGGVVAYANSAKEGLLGVRTETLEKHGAVSAPCAIEMAEGALKAYDVDFAAAITGIAGPGGGTPEKPVGTVFTACAGKNRPTETAALYLPLDRDRVREYSANIALFSLYRFIVDSRKNSKG